MADNIQLPEIGRQGKIDWADSPQEIFQGIEWLSQSSTTYDLHPSVMLMQFGVYSFESKQGLARGNPQSSVAGIGHFMRPTYNTLLDRAGKRLKGDEDPLLEVISAAKRIRNMDPKDLPVSNGKNRDYRNYDDAALIIGYEVLLDEARQIATRESTQHLAEGIRATGFYFGHNLGGTHAQHPLGANDATFVRDLPIACDPKKLNVLSTEARDAVLDRQGDIYDGTVGEAHERVGEKVYRQHGIPGDMRFKRSEDGNNLIPADQYSAAIGLVGWERHRTFYENNSEHPYAKGDTAIHYDIIRAEMEGFQSMKGDPVAILMESGILADPDVRERYGITGNDEASAKAYLEQFGVALVEPEKAIAVHTFEDNSISCVGTNVVEHGDGAIMRAVKARVAELNAEPEFREAMQQCGHDESCRNELYMSHMEDIQSVVGSMKVRAGSDSRSRHAPNESLRPKERPEGLADMSGAEEVEEGGDFAPETSLRPVARPSSKGIS